MGATEKPSLGKPVVRGQYRGNADGARPDQPRPPGPPNSRLPTRAARPASSSCSATCTTGWPVGGALVNLADYLEDTLLSGFGVVLSYDLGNGLNIERGGDLVDKWQGAELKKHGARAAAGDPVDRPLPALSRQPARPRQQGKDAERRGDPARRGSHHSGRRLGLRTRQHHQPAARLGQRIAVPRPGVHEPADRRQSQRRRAADRRLAADHARARAAAGCQGARSARSAFSRSSLRVPSPPTPNSPSSPARSRASRSPASKAW